MYSEDVTKNTFDSQVGLMVQTVARARKTNLKRLATQMDLPYSSLHERIHGRRKWTAEEIRDLARCLEISTDELLGLAPLTLKFEFACVRMWAGQPTFALAA